MTPTMYEFVDWLSKWCLYPVWPTGQRWGRLYICTSGCSHFHWGPVVP